MTTETPSSSLASPGGMSGLRGWLISGTLFVAAAIIFGLLYLFVIAPSVPDGSIGWYLFSFATGLTMIVMPCTLPLAFVIVPLSMGKGMIKGLSMALAFGFGVAFTLSLYGIAAALLGGIAVSSLGADLEAIKNWIYFGAGTFALLFALSEIGLMNFHMPTYSGAAPAFIQKRQEILKAFFLGAFLGNVGVGCPHPATPLILIEIASSGDVLYGWTMFLIHAVGRVLPLLLLAFLAILGVNGLNWLMARKDKLERATGWAMVFVSGFILTLGLFSHKWWVNSGIHSALESVTQEGKVNAIMNDTLGTNVAHLHGIEAGTGLFGLPLELGSWFLVFVWLLPIWWWYARRRREMHNSPAYKVAALEAQIDRLERDRRQVETMMNVDELEVTYDLKHAREEIDALEATRRAEEAKVAYGETGVYKDPVARGYEEKILGIQRNYLIAISVFLAILFIYFLPRNFYLKQFDPAATTHHVATPTTQAPVLERPTFTKDITGLPEATGPLFVELANGDTYNITAGYVKKEIGNKMVRMLAYNGSVPGPFIKTTEGSVITVNFKNNTDVDQTIHSHGLRLNNLMDGTPDLSQNVVKPGESFTYTLSFPDAGVAWYHPHTRDDYGQEMGLYGSYIVASNNPDYWSEVNREVPIMIDDVLIENNQIADFYKDTVDHALLGRFGNMYLVNGESDALLDVKAGEVVRFFLTNVSNARTYKLAIPGAQIKVVGAEWGRLEQEVYEESVLLSPAERLVVEVYFPEEGLYKLLNMLPDRQIVVAQFDAQEEEALPSYVENFNVARRNIEEKALFDQYRQAYLAQEPEKRALLTVTLTGAVDHNAHAHGGAASATSVDESMPHGHGAGTAMPMMQSGIEAMQWDDAQNTDKVNTTENVAWNIIDQTTGKINMGINDWTFKQGSLVKIRFTNDMMAAHVMQHPIHFHGQRFVVLSNNGVPNDNMVWKDTALVPPSEYIDVLVEMSNPGVWMAHCHISEHLHAGMMFSFRVEDQNGNAIGDEFRATVKPTASGSTPPPAGATSGGPVTPGSVEPLAYSYTDQVSDREYTVSADTRFVEVGKNTLLALTFSDSQGAAMVLDDVIPRPITITFVRSDGSVRFVTYPGNTTFPEPTTVPAGDQNVPGAPGFNESMPHLHSMLPPSLFSIPVAYAHGGIADGHEVAAGGRTYSVPTQFPTEGQYRAFVSFVLKGESAPRIATFDIEVGTPSFSVDNFGWSPNKKWWILLIISLLLTVPLVLVVKKYLKAEIK